jgi:hypothetical protein
MRFADAALSHLGTSTRERATGIEPAWDSLATNYGTLPPRPQYLEQETRIERA